MPDRFPEIDSSTFQKPDQLNATPLVRSFEELRVVSGKYAPYHDLGRKASVSLPSDFKIEPQTRPQDIPVGDYPVLSHQPDRELYLQSGEWIVKLMRESLHEDGFRFAPGKKVLDFGCFSGRLLRWFLEEARAGIEFWGVDIDAYVLDWISARMSPPFNFAVTTTEPHLPFPDGYFDFLYAGSVFTHMTDLTDAWLLEVRRVLHADGRAYLTFNDQHSVKLLETKWPGSYDDIKFRECQRDLGVALDQANFFCMDCTPYASVFYNTRFLESKLKRLFRLKSIRAEAFGWQTAYLVQKPAV